MVDVSGNDGGSWQLRVELIDSQADAVMPQTRQADGTSVRHGPQRATTNARLTSRRRSPDGLCQASV
jgi:hypothetical protein